MSHAPELTVGSVRLSKPVKHRLSKKSLILKKMVKKSLKLFFARSEGNIIPRSRRYMCINDIVHQPFFRDF